MIKKRERGNWAKCIFTENLLLTTSYFWAISAACRLFPLPGGPKKRTRGVKGAGDRCRLWTKARTTTGGERQKKKKKITGFNPFLLKKIKFKHWFTTLFIKKINVVMLIVVCFISETSRLCTQNQDTDKTVLSAKFILRGILEISLSLHSSFFHQCLSNHFKEQIQLIIALLPCCF